MTETATKPAKKRRECRECGADLTGRDPRAHFCGKACRLKWHNRRKERGADLYDFVMAWRFDRKEAEELDARGMMGRLASAFRDADKAFRDGRKSWNLGEAYERIPLAFGHEGDKR